VIYTIQKTPRSRMMVVHLDRLAPYQGVARDEPTYKGGTVAEKRGKTRATGRKLSPALRRKEWWYTIRLFGTNNLKKEAV
jgi:hypothetical protein